MINNNNEKNLATICKVISLFPGVLISGWLVGFSDFQRNLRLGSKLSDRVVDLRNKADFSSVLSSKALIHDCTPRVFYKSKTYPFSRMNVANRSKFLTCFKNRSIVMTEEKDKLLKDCDLDPSLCRKPCSIN